SGADGSRRSGQPWFLWLHVFDPHAPYRPPPPFDAQYSGKPYYGEVAATDAALAPLFNDVRALARPTLVVVTADHGEALGEHGEEAHGLFAYESTLRVPLIIAEMGGTHETRGADRTSVSSVAARHVDILPTILDAVGQPVPPDLPGRSLLPAAERAPGAAPRPSYFEAMSAMLNRGGAPLTGVAIDRDKFIDLPIPERYDLAADAAELTNLAGRAPERDRALAVRLREFNALPAGERRPESAEAEARLRALGYVSGQAARKDRYTDEDDPKRLVEIDASMHRAVEAFAARRVDEALEIYRGVVRRRPDMAIAYRHLAFIEWQRGQSAAAVDVLQRALAAGVTQPAIVAQLGGYLSDVNRAADAIRLL